MSDVDASELDGLTLYEAALLLQNGLLAHATDGSVTARGSKNLVPTFVRTCRDPGQFWGYIKARWGHYHERRTEIYEAFTPLLDALERLTWSTDEPGCTSRRVGPRNPGWFR